jgi:hypothetical protein
LSVEKYKRLFAFTIFSPLLPSRDTQKKMMKQILREGGDRSEQVQRLMSVAKLAIQ